MVTSGDLAEAPLLRLLPEPLLARLAQVATVSSFRAGDVLFREGDPGDRIHLLRSGEVEVVKRGTGPLDTLVLGRCRPGDVFGELAVLTGGPRSATLVALTDGSSATIDASALEAVVLGDAAAMRPLLAGLASSLTAAKEELTAHNHLLELRVQARTEEVRETHLEVLRRLGEAVESRDDETGEHIMRMSRMAAALGERAGLRSDEAEMLLRAAPLHDIGKIAIADDILRKPGRLTRGERATMQTHTALGAKLLAGSRSPVVRMAESIALHHHERWDGTGYPHGLAGEAIPLAARVCAIVDVFDALVSERHYKRAWSPAAALAEVAEGSGTAFDPSLIAIFVRHFDEVRGAADPEASGERTEVPPTVARAVPAPDRARALR